MKRWLERRYEKKLAARYQLTVANRTLSEGAKRAARSLRNSKARAWDEGYRQAVTDVVGAQEEILHWQWGQNPYRSES
jgi:hypothetical protein